MTVSSSGSSSRGGFASRLGFILAAAGSAVGLGNIWRFPYMAAENGGGAFVLLYVVFVLAIGIPILLAELSLGRATATGPVGAFRRATSSRAWPWVGGLGVLTGFGILAFYSVVAGWTLSYLGRALTGQFAESLDGPASEAMFRGIIASPAEGIATTAAFLLLTAIVVRGGIQGGIERWAKVLMPAFLGLLVVLAVRSLNLPGAGRGVAFMFVADFDALGEPRVYLYALGQALFSLSLGMGAMITFGSYLAPRENLWISAASVAAFDTSIAMLAGFIIFPALFSAGVDPSGGPGLVFVVLPTIFSTMPAGSLFAAAFYVLLAIAALTSTISLLEVVVTYLVDERRWSRERAVWGTALGCLLLAIPSTLSQGASAFFSSFGGRGFLELQSILFGNFSLTIGAFLLAVFVGWVWGIGAAREQLGDVGLTRVWGGLLRFVCPLAIVAVLGFIAWTGEFF